MSRRLTHLATRGTPGILPWALWLYLLDLSKLKRFYANFTTHVLTTADFTTLCKTAAIFAAPFVGTSTFKSGEKRSAVFTPGHECEVSL